MDISQTIIVTLGILSATIFNSGKPVLSKYGSLCLLLSQPFWIYSTFANKQYGMLALSIYYTAAAAFGVFNGFIKKSEVKN